MKNYEYVKGKSMIIIVESFKEIDPKEDAIYIISHKKWLNINKDYIGYATIPDGEPVSINIKVTDDPYYKNSTILLVPVLELPSDNHYDIIRGGGYNEVLSASAKLISKVDNETAEPEYYKCSYCNNKISYAELHDNAGNITCPYCNNGFNRIYDK